MKKAFYQLNNQEIVVEDSRLKPPRVTYLPGEELWRLEELYVHKQKNVTVRVPAGFYFDLASVPKLFWRIIAPFELSIAAPLLHDVLYRCKGHPPDHVIDPDDTIFSRAESDDLFNDVMEQEGVKAWRRKLTYWAVSVFGKCAWKRQDEELQMRP